MPMAKNRPKQIEKRIERIKLELAKIEVMRPGSLTRQYKDPQQQTGAYYQLSYTLDMRSRTEYIRKECLSEVRHQINLEKSVELTPEGVKIA